MKSFFNYFNKIHLKLKFYNLIFIDAGFFLCKIYKKHHFYEYHLIATWQLLNC